MTEDSGFTGVLEQQAHSRLRNWFSSTPVKSKDKSDSRIFEFSFLRIVYFFIFAMIVLKIWEVVKGAAVLPGV
jgi:hypothetical protein